MNNRVEVNGILLLDKPKGLSSNHALQQAKRLFQAQKAGHSGCLDPLATGMLPLCFGEATKFSQYLLDASKRYLVTGRLGIKTATGDAEGEVIAQTTQFEVSDADILNLIPQFLGEITQVPPIYSALKYQGQPLYKYARKGIEVPIPARKVIISELKLITRQENDITLEVACSKGTYIRTLIQDLGDRLGCGAAVIELRRLDVGHFSELPMYTLDFLTALEKTQGKDGLNALLLPLDSFLGDLPQMNLAPAHLNKIVQGQRVLSSFATPGIIKLYSEAGTFIGLGEVLPDNMLKAKRLVMSNHNDRSASNSR